MAEKSKPPKRYQDMKMRFSKVVDQYETFSKAIEESGPLSPREQRLVKLGLAFGARMEGASHSAVRKAMDAGLKPDEVEHAAMLGMSTMGFPNGMTFLGWVQDVLSKLEEK